MDPRVTVTVVAHGPAHHWDGVYASRPTSQVSWYEERPATSLRLLAAAVPVTAGVVDVGAGASFLVDALLDAGWADVTVLDVSEAALEVVRSRLPHSPVSFVVADVLEWRPERRFDAWHDRAVFHFLTGEHDRRRYAATATAAVTAGGAVVLGTFAEDGPAECSGLPTAGYSAEELADVFAPAFACEHAEREVHVTPQGVAQPFTWVILRRT